MQRHLLHLLVYRLFLGVEAGGVPRPPLRAASSLLRAWSHKSRFPKLFLFSAAPSVLSSRCRSAAPSSSVADCVHIWSMRLYFLVLPVSGTSIESGRLPRSAPSSSPLLSSSARSLCQQSLSIVTFARPSRAENLAPRNPPRLFPCIEPRICFEAWPLSSLPWDPMGPMHLCMLFSLSLRVLLLSAYLACFALRKEVDLRISALPSSSSVFWVFQSFPS